MSENLFLKEQPRHSPVTGIKICSSNRTNYYRKCIRTNSDLVDFPKNIEITDTQIINKLSVYILLILTI